MENQAVLDLLQIRPSKISKTQSGTSFSKLTPRFFREAVSLDVSVTSRIRVTHSGIKSPERLLSQAAKSLTPASTAVVINKIKKEKGPGTQTISTIGTLRKIVENDSEKTAYLYRHKNNLALYIIERTPLTKKTIIIPLSVPWSSCKNEPFCNIN
ncbi:MAG: hypothetical protein HQ564_10435 [Candidatus Saganbacteria bacterium]|nr:hypothetical protein [Candidatus Saganbacteria bacterium]